MSNVDNDDMEEEVVQTPHVSQNVATPSTPRTLLHGSVQGKSTLVAAQATLTTCTLRGQQTPSRSWLRSTSTNPIKTIIMHEIYDATTPYSFFVFALFSQIDDPLTFEEVVKDEVLAQAMDE